MLYIDPRCLTVPGHARKIRQAAPRGRRGKEALRGLTSRMAIDGGLFKKVGAICREGWMAIAPPRASPAAAESWTYYARIVGL